jgi:uncharacterized protein YjhX (UPF0386 family)
VNILGDVWSILVLVNYSVALDLRHLESVLHFHPCFVIFRYLWWFVTWSWRHGLWKRYDPVQQTTTIRRHTKFQVWPQHEEGDSFRLLSIHLYIRTDSGRTHRWNVHTDHGEVITNCRILVFVTDLWHLRLVASCFESCFTRESWTWTSFFLYSHHQLNTLVFIRTEKTRPRRSVRGEEGIRSQCYERQRTEYWGDWSKVISCWLSIFQWDPTWSSNRFGRSHVHPGGMITHRSVSLNVTDVTTKI